MGKGDIFIASKYKVGKSTLCDKLNKKLNIPLYINKMEHNQSDIDKIVAIIQGSVS